jgi:type I restriction enzyme R subunit
MTTPNIDELSASHIPALATLCALGWRFLAPVDCLEQRGGEGGALLRADLIAHLSRHRFDYRGAVHPLSTNSIDFIVRTLSAPPMQDGLLAANQRVYEWLTLGITVTEFVDGKKLSITVPLIDWQDVAANRFVVTEELAFATSDGTRTRRPDIVGFVNGIPMIVIEAKRPVGGGAQRMVEEGISQTIRNQKPDEIPLLFAYAQVLFAVSGSEGRYGTTGTPRKFWASWRDEEFDEAHYQAVKNGTAATDRTSLLQDRVRDVRESVTRLWSDEMAVTEQDRLLIGIASPGRLLEFVRFFLFFDRKVGKIAARHQQMFGIRKLIAEISKVRPADHPKGPGREGGTIWHTTGSGKSFTMVLLCKALLLHAELAECRVVVVTDRTDLEKQLATNFLTGGAFGTALSDKEGGRAKVQSGRDLAKRIGKGTDRIIFTIINKFASASKLPECRNDSPNIIVLVDEGHRSQGGENHERMRKALPQASYVAFTGTPLLKGEKTEGRFGKIIHAYTMRDAIDDGTVTPLLYEERKPVLDINERAIDSWFDMITRGLSDDQKTDLKKKYASRGQLYGAEGRIRRIAWDIAAHFRTNFKDQKLGLKGQIATDSKLSAIRYKKGLDETGLVSSAIIISPPDTREGHEDVHESELPEVQQWWVANVKGDPDAYERQMIDDFSTEGRPDLLIVVDKLLTGFDEPRNAVLYIDKPLKAHNLIQAIARVNRLHDQKQYGFLVDYRGILKELDTAIGDYQDLATRTQGGFDIADLDGLYRDVCTEYKRLPGLHADLWKIFNTVRNRADDEQFRQLLVPRYADASGGERADLNQKRREDFYEALTAFGMCLKTALSSRSFFEDGAFSEQQIAEYKRDLRFFSALRQQARQDAFETIDFSQYEKQIRKMIDTNVIGEDIAADGKLLSVAGLRTNDDPESWSDEKTRNETDIIRSRLTRTIEHELAEDPYAQAHFSDLLRKAIAEAAALFEYPRKQYDMFEELEASLATRTAPGIPVALANRPHARAYYGIFCLHSDALAVDWGAAHEDAACRIEEIVAAAVAENSLNPANIEAAVRKGALPILFGLFGLDRAKIMTDEIVNITRIGLANGKPS